MDNALAAYSEPKKASSGHFSSKKIKIDRPPLGRQRRSKRHCNTRAALLQQVFQVLSFQTPLATRQGPEDASQRKTPGT